MGWLWFTHSTYFVRDAKHRENIREYLLRGGFLFVEACIHPTANPDPDAYFVAETRSLQAILPGLKITALPDRHDIFRAFFEIEGGPPHMYVNDGPRWMRYPLHMLIYQDRNVGLLSMSGLQCGILHGGSNLSDDCTRMFVNIYIYAMTH